MEAPAILLAGLPPFLFLVSDILGNGHDFLFFLFWEAAPGEVDGVISSIVTCEVHTYHHATSGWTRLGSLFSLLHEKAFSVFVLPLLVWI